MAFRIKPDEGLAEAIRRIVGDQIDKALGGLADRGGSEPEKAVHDARKRFKKVRAVLRLARFGLGRKLGDRENARFRDAGRPLSEVRDATALVEAFDKLVERSGVPDHPEAVGFVRAALIDRRRGLVDKALDDAETLVAVVAAVEGARVDVKRWAIKGGDGEVLGRGLKRIYRAGRDAAQVAASAPTDEALHEWRKRVKDLWYALDLLEPIRPQFIKGLRGQAHRLADALGDDHDLAVLRQILEDPDSGIGDRAAIEAIGPLIDGRRGELQEKARHLGDEVYAEKPGAFASRFDTYWRAWRAEAEAARFDPPHAPGKIPEPVNG